MIGHEMSELDDKAFAGRLLQSLPTVAVPSALEARLLADFDRIAAARQPGKVKRIAWGWAERLWPGVPAWQPASLLVLSLVIGLTAGAFVPSLNSASAAANSDQSVALSDATFAMDLYKDL